MTRSISRSLVQLAARTLPAAKRDRYREQWLADLRDADVVGIRPSQIALAALAFSATMARPLPSGRTLTAEQISRRGRVASALALGAALLGLSQYASSVPIDDLTDGLNPGISIPPPGEVLTGFLVVFAVIAPVLGVVIAAATRGISRRVRLAVILLAIASCAPVIQQAIDGTNMGPLGAYLSPGDVAYLIGGLVTVTAIVLLVQTRLQSSDAPALRPLRAFVSAIIVAGTAVAGSAIASAVWAHRRTVVWTNGTSAGPALKSNPYYLQWLTSWNRGEEAITVTFEWWIIAGVLLGSLFALFAIVSRVSTRTLALLVAGTVAEIVLATLGLLTFLQLAEGQTVDMGAVNLAFVLARVGLVLVVATGAIAAASASSPDASSRARRASRRVALP